MKTSISICQCHIYYRNLWGMSNPLLDICKFLRLWEVCKGLLWLLLPGQRAYSPYGMPVSVCNSTTAGSIDNSFIVDSLLGVSLCALLLFCYSPYIYFHNTIFSLAKLWSFILCFFLRSRKRPALMPWLAHPLMIAFFRICTCSIHEQLLGSIGFQVSQVFVSRPLKRFFRFPNFQIPRFSQVFGGCLGWETAGN